MTSPGPVCGNVTRRSGTVAGVTGETIAFLAQALADEMEDGGCAYYGQVERLRIDGGQLVETGRVGTRPKTRLRGDECELTSC